MTISVLGADTNRARHNKAVDIVARRHEAIFDRFGQGMAPDKIATSLGLTTRHVRRVLLDGGHQLGGNPGGKSTDSIWDMDDDARRIAIARRAQRGARLTLGMRDRLRQSKQADAETAASTTGVVPPKPAFSRIIAEVAESHFLQKHDLVGPSREARIVAARHELIWRLRTETKLSFGQIGAKIGRDHSTVIHGFKMHQERMAAYARARAAK